MSNYSGLRVVLVSDPAHPVEVGYHHTPDEAKAVAVDGDHAYVAVNDVGLQIYQFYAVGAEEKLGAEPSTAHWAPAVWRAADGRPGTGGRRPGGTAGRQR